MKTTLALITLLWVLMPGTAWAQAVDVDLGPPISGQWNVTASWDPADDYAEVVFFREDTGEELGRADAPFVKADSPTGQAVTTLVTIAAVVPPADICIRAYALDDVGNRSADSGNCAIADVTAPRGPPVMLSVSDHALASDAS